MDVLLPILAGLNLGCFLEILPDALRVAKRMRVKASIYLDDFR